MVNKLEAYEFKLAFANSKLPKAFREAYTESVYELTQKNLADKSARFLKVLS
jgi:hypothetical protein